MSQLLGDLWPLVRTQGLFSFFINLLFLVPALFMLQVFDRVLPSNSEETLIVLLVGTLIALGVLLLLDYVRSRLQNVLGGLVDEYLSPAVVNSVVAKTSRGAPMQSDAIRDVNALRNLFSTSGLIALFDAPWLAVYVLVIFAFHPALGWAALAFSISMLALAWCNDKLSRASIEELQREARHATRYMEGSLRNAEVIQALGMTDNLLVRWRGLQEKVSTLQRRASRTGVRFAAGTRFVRQTIQVLMLALGAHLVLTQQASAGIMIATTILLARALQPVEQLVGNWKVLGEGRAAFRRLRELFGEMDREHSCMELPRPTGRLTVEALSYRAPGTDKLIVVALSFDLQPGEALAIVGPSAAGKSTLARLLTGIWPPTTGVIRLDGADVARWSRASLGPWIGYLPQDVELFEGTVAENIARLAQADTEAVVRGAQDANVHDLVLALPQGYDTQVGEQGNRLSPGQRQRIALARALYGDPRLVILDEPNSNLDGAGEMALAAAVSGLRKRGITSIVVTHRPSLIAHVDKILVLEAGRIQQYGPAAEVMRWLQRSAQTAVAGRSAA